MMLIHRRRAVVGARTIVRAVTRTVSAVLVVTATVASLLATPQPARAQRSGDVAPIRPIRLEGYWNRDQRAPGVLDGLTFTSDQGGPHRTFGVTRLQAYKPEEEGTQVLRHSGLLPSIRVLGRSDMVRRFINAPETEKVIALGVYRPATGTLTLNSIEVGGRP
jgi:hypothetical protein